MHLQFRIVAAMLLLGLLALGSGSLLLLGYALAAFSIGMIVFIMARRMIKRIADARLDRRGFLQRRPTVTSRTTNENQRLAA